MPFTITQDRRKKQESGSTARKQTNKTEIKTEIKTETKTNETANQKSRNLPDAY
jgi:hypothetical protein